MSTQLAAKVRAKSGKGVARSLRREGFVPGIVYGPGKENIQVYVDVPGFTQLMKSGASNELVSLQLENEKKTVLIKDVTTDPVRGDYLHVDFYEVPLDKLITTTVPLNVVGEEERANDGGILVVNLREIEVSCLPINIPRSLDVEVSGLSVGDSLHVSDIVLPENVEAVTDSQEVIASVVVPTAEPTEEEEGEEGIETVEEESAEEATEENE